MPRYRIQTYGGAGVGIAGLGISGTTMLIENRDTRETAVYDLVSGDAGKSIWPFSLTFLSSWSDFESPCSIDNFGGAVVLWGATAGANKSGIRFMSGCANGKYINTSGVQAGTPSVGGSAGKMTYRGMMKRPVRAWSQCDYTVAIWYPRGGIDPWNRTMMQGLHSLSYWGYLAMSTVVNKDSTAESPTYTWSWNPYQSEYLSARLMSARSGVWSLGSLANMGGAEGTLVEGSSSFFGGNNYKTFATLDRFQRVLEEGQDIVPNNFTSAAKIRDVTNGIIADIGIIWFLTKERNVGDG